MNPYLALAIICIMLWIGGLFMGALRGMSSGLESTPTVQSSSSRETREKFEDDVDDLKEKNQRFVDDVKSKADNLKSKMENSRM
jgi:hypothetical protein